MDEEIIDDTKPDEIKKTNETESIKPKIFEPTDEGK